VARCAEQQLQCHLEGDRLNCHLQIARRMSMSAAEILIMNHDHDIRNFVYRLQLLIERQATCSTILPGAAVDGPDYSS
jgi:hypothetical protein